MKSITFNKALVAALLVAGTFTFQACGDQKRAKAIAEETDIDEDALVFTKAANEGNLAEVSTAQLVKQKSKNPRVLAFADMMIADHTTANKELRTIIDDKKVTITDTVGAMHKAMADSLNKKSGADFDKAYMTMMVMDHQKTIELFHDASQNRSKAVKDFAEKTLPKLRAHLDSAKAITASLK
jgi:putative membrane protein